MSYYDTEIGLKLSCLATRRRREYVVTAGRRSWSRDAVRHPTLLSFRDVR